MAAQAVSGGIRFIGARCDAGAGDHRMLAEDQRGILDEHRVGIVGQLGQADDLEPRVLQRPLIGGVLSRGLGGIDRHALEVGQLALGEPRADGAGEGAPHLRFSTQSMPLPTRRRK